jgi:hypothetical protein
VLIHQAADCAAEYVYAANVDDGIMASQVKMYRIELIVSYTIRSGTWIRISQARIEPPALMPIP